MPADTCDWHGSRGVDPESLDWGRVQALGRQNALLEKQSGLHVSMLKAGTTPDLLLLILSHTSELHSQDPTASDQAVPMSSLQTASGNVQGFTDGLLAATQTADRDVAGC